MNQFLVVDDLKVHFPTPDGVVKATDGLSFTLERGKTLGIVGESGSGKSVSSSAILGLHRGTPARVSGSIQLDGVDLLTLSDEEMRRKRGREVAMIFQDPLSAMHPYFTVGRQLSEAYRVHHKVSRKKAKVRVMEMLDRVGIPSPDRRYHDYPHQFSGGMRQRAMIAMALINDPTLVIADEPTTALDVTVQAQILDLLRDLQREFDTAIIMITHDLGVVAEMVDDVLVMYGGKAVEYGPVKDVMTHPEMPYTWGLLSSVPDITSDPNARMVPIPGNPPSLLSPPSGCAFHPRCAFRQYVEGDRCRTEVPELVPGAQGLNHLKRCHLPDPDMIYERQVLPEIAPDRAEEL
ncbi:ABC transporter ATP-binding protein [Nocardioides jishulii]|uniref:ABC transporter ATP-binding protein n=1 Tax=Nocardioides jishulii TaxID=2575440 RepID=A0A4U2YM37_9ACTN|nr:ABC transporter ATP-binding protein [Nocardioides jishulii]QCX27442.1 ABC transporter ATP-binding protein [Nocardioides jishulii]TKI62248.1 ABC transporter ATP-binding protein [Nocardioides jishulii]